jgi:hypothetical protein
MEPAPGTVKNAPMNGRRARRQQLALALLLDIALQLGGHSTAHGAQAAATPIDGERRGDEPTMGETAATMTPDEQAKAVTRRLLEVAGGARTLLRRQCPDARTWDGWLEDVLRAAAAVAGVGDIGGALKKNGASEAALQAFEAARGSEGERASLASEAKLKVDTCATRLGVSPPPPETIVRRFYLLANTEKRRLEEAVGLVHLYKPVKEPR